MRTLHVFLKCVLVAVTGRESIPVPLVTKERPNGPSDPGPPAMLAPPPLSSHQKNAFEWGNPLFPHTPDAIQITTAAGAFFVK